MPELSPYEWRTLHATTSSRTFQFDVIGNLPVELVAQVFSHLDVAAPYRLQTSLNSWYQGTVNFQDADHALCQKKARKINAFRTGKPRKVYKITPKDSIDDIYLAGNSLIWQSLTENESLGIAPIIQPATQTIILFANAARNNDVPFHQQFFAFGRYTYSGECLSTHHANLHGVTSLSYFSRDPNTFVPVDDKQNILSIVMRDTNGKSSFLVRFNEEEMEMSVWEGSRLYEHPEFTDTNGAMAWWKDTCYAAFWDGDVEGEMRDTIALMDGNADKHDMNAVEGASAGKTYKLIVSELVDEESLDLDINAPVVMNEDYVIRNAGNRFYILCFDDDDEGKKPQENGSFFDLGELEVSKGMDTWFDQPHYKGWLQSRPYARVKEIWGPELERRRQELSLSSESD
ncbi:uncharacterized protein J4E78_008820 [Alternaria triticimaculans]|uniref:uncharacterized protein n=1 Tax=Alternaria triticimaculans TaxID=297637 RepID=UPI0020C4B56A|nr:uncharacterized protein J4E78_008820 [Alternaria triticimaculans]KAI4647506.1 hypothetical protein J4E78_008820 [Alternaria triticimaculans]